MADAPGLGPGGHSPVGVRVPPSAPLQRKVHHVAEIPISRYPVPAIDELPDDIKALVLAVQEKAGFVPNVFLALAHRPDEFRAFFAYHDALMEKESGLTKAEREMIVVTTSGANNCQYCVVAHGAILRVRAKNSLIADQVAVTLGNVDGEIADLTNSDPPTQAEVQKLRDACEELADIAHPLSTLLHAQQGALGKGVE